MSRHQVEVLTSFSQISAQEWQSLDRGDFIFADYGFLTSLEDGGALGRRTGWYPQILALKENGIVRAACPLFLRSNSYGEYIFDWSWANASEQAGHNYYPKLTSAIPFTPATGPKFLIHRDENAVHARELLTEAALELASRTHSSSVHFLFTTPDENAQLEKSEFAIRHSYQFHWQNPGWRDFQDFLGAFRSKRRSEIRREREAVRALPLKIETLTGADLTAEHAGIMHAFYVSTVRKMGGIAYLTRGFFEQLFQRLSSNILLVVAYEGIRPVAGAINLYSGNTLFGRHWGCAEEYRNLHFEVCYYRAIDWALANGVTLFEAGAQGEHKFNRGFTPNLCYSAHRLFHEPLHRAVASFIEEEKSAIRELFADYDAHDPFKREPSSSGLTLEKDR
jgi:predicted N-acyltransferase